LFTLAFCSFALLGVVLVLVGASYEQMSAALELDLDQMALLGATLSLGIGGGVLVAGPAVDRLPRRPIFTGACSVTALSLLSVDADMGLSRAMFHVLAMGFGAGLCETLINTITVERFGKRAIRPLTLLHSAATLGAVATPPLIGGLAAAGDFTLAFRLTGAAWLLTAVFALFVRLAPPRPPLPGRPRALFTPSLIALCVVAFAYVGIEAGVTLFAVPYATQSLGLEAGSGRSAISSFWFGLLVGRLALVVMISRADARHLIAAGLGTALVFAVGIGFGLTQIEWVVGLCGFSAGMVFPLMVTLAGEWFPDTRGTATGIVVGVGCLGGFVVPSLTGMIAELSSVAVAVGSFSLWALCIAAAAYAAQATRATRATSQA
jgi:fucose permease